MNSPVETTARTIAERYQLEDLLKDGSCRQTWRGLDLTDQRGVIVKLIKLNPLTEGAAFQARLRGLTALKQPGLLPVHDSGLTNDGAFVVYDRMEVGSLRDYIGREIISTSQVIRWMIDIGETLEYVHSMQVLHRNIKPSNLMIDLDGQALLSDFELVAPESSGQDAPDADVNFNYFSPERIEGRTVDARSDLYSLGVVFHELLTGNLPYDPVGHLQMKSEILRGAHPEQESIPREVRHIVKKVLARNPQQRYGAADQFVDDLRRVIVGASTRRWTIATAGVALFVIGFTASSWYFEGKPHATVDAAKQQQIDWVKKTTQLSGSQRLTAVVDRLKYLNPEFDGEVHDIIEDTAIVELAFSTDQVKDISPLAALTELRSLTCTGAGSSQSSGKLADLSPLKGLPIKSLTISNNESVNDLSPLSNMPLTRLDCSRTSVANLSPIRTCPLTVLICSHTQVSELAAISQLKLQELYCDHTTISDLSPLEGMPLNALHCEDTSVATLEPLRHLPLKVLDCYRTSVSDLSPLRGQAELTSLNFLSTLVKDLSPLKDLPKIQLLWCDFDEKRDQDILKSLNSLQFINDNPVAVFWKEALR